MQARKISLLNLATSPPSKHSGRRPIRDQSIENLLL